MRQHAWRSLFSDFCNIGTELLNSGLDNECERQFTALSILKCVWCFYINIVIWVYFCDLYSLSEVNYECYSAFLYNKVNNEVTIV